MKLPKNQSGVAALELVLLVVIVAIIGFVGFKVYDASRSADKSLEQADSVTPNNQKTAETEANTVAPIKSTADLDSAEKTLDGVNPDEGSTDAAELDSNLSAF